MAAHGTLDASIALQRQQINEETKYEILGSLWGPNLSLFTGAAGKSSIHDAYFAYYFRQCNIAFHDDGRHISLRTHNDITEIARHIKSGKTRDELQAWLSSKLQASTVVNTEHIDSSIDLTVRLILMMDVGDLKFGFCTQTPLVWTNKSLEDWTHEYFDTPQVLDHQQVKLEGIFNARNLVKIAGFEIQWTDNLADHLRIMSQDDKKVAIFHHASFLAHQRENTLFPKGFIDETIRTISLLLPQAEPRTRKWYRGLLSRATLSLDERAAFCPGLRAVDRHIEKFTFWRDRIIVLKQIFDEAEPRTLSQWWCDRRNGVQWYTFWVAIVVLMLTLLLGLVQCIEGAFQVHYAHMALAQPTT